MAIVVGRSNPIYRSDKQDNTFVVINAKRTNLDLPLPKQETEGSAGYDLRTPVGFKLLPGESTIVPDGLVLKIPKGYFGLIKPRSSMAKAGLIIDAGVIDQDYRGEIHVIMYNRNRL